MDGLATGGRDNVTNINSSASGSLVEPTMIKHSNFDLYNRFLLCILAH
jgi:hypothetical protein